MSDYAASLSLSLQIDHDKGSELQKYFPETIDTSRPQNVAVRDAP